MIKLFRNETIRTPQTGKYGSRENGWERGCLSHLHSIMFTLGLYGKFDGTEPVDELLRRMERTPQGRRDAKSFRERLGSGNFVLDAVDKGTHKIVGPRSKFERTHLEAVSPGLPSTYRR